MCVTYATLSAARRSLTRAPPPGRTGPHALMYLAVITRQVAAVTNMPAHYKLIRFNYLFTSNVLEIQRVNKV